MKRPSLLFLSHRLPYPPHNGAAIRTFNILKQLARDFEVTALCFDREDPALTQTREERLAALRPYAEVEVFPIPQESSRLRLAWDHLRSVVTRRPYTYYVHDSAAFKGRLKHHLTATEWSLVHLDSLDLLRFLPMVSGSPVVCTHHNVESALLRRRAEAEPSALLRGYMRFQADRLDRAERSSAGAITLNVAVSEDDAAAFRRMMPGAEVMVVPNGVDTQVFQPRQVPQRDCVFVGGTSWFPNKDGLEWFVTAILPELEEGRWDSRVVWVGRATDDEMSRLRGVEGLALTGYVDDIQPYVQAAACFIVPLRVGGGTRLKILDAWAMGKAVVSTTIGCEGLRAAHGENILIADTPAEFAGAMIQLLRNQDLRKRIGEEARNTAERFYSWESIGESMRARYREIARVASTS